MRCSVTRPSFRCATLCLMTISVGYRLRPPGYGNVPEPEARSLERDLLLMRRLIHAHPEAEPHGVQDLLDLVERLAPEVLRLQHLRLGLLHELADGADVGVLQAIV